MAGGPRVECLVSCRKWALWLQGGETKAQRDHGSSQRHLEGPAVGDDHLQASVRGSGESQRGSGARHVSSRSDHYSRPEEPRAPPSRGQRRIPIGR